MFARCENTFAFISATAIKNLQKGFGKRVRERTFSLKRFSPAKIQFRTSSRLGEGDAAEGGTAILLRVDVEEDAFGAHGSLRDLIGGGEFLLGAGADDLRLNAENAAGGSGSRLVQAGIQCPYVQETPCCKGL